VWFVGVASSAGWGDNNTIAITPWREGQTWPQEVVGCTVICDQPVFPHRTTPCQHSLQPHLFAEGLLPGTRKAAQTQVLPRALPALPLMLPFVFGEETAAVTLALYDMQSSSTRSNQQFSPAHSPHKHQTPHSPKVARLYGWMDEILLDA
jgi:hypothetical protein